VRKTVDGIQVNIPDDQLAWAMQKLVAGGGTGAASFNVTPAGQKEEDEGGKPIEYKAKDFVVNFLQTSEDKEEDPMKAINEKLKEAGLATTWKRENKQRALVFGIINTAANNALSFPAFYNMVKMAKIYS